MADAPAATACGPWTVDFGFDEFEEKYLEQRPAGTYDVYAALWWTDGDGTIGLAVSEPVTMDVPSIDVPEEPAAR